jgi:aryl-alcohol dehydrogenase-like predicted oxidoreductase
MQQRLLGNSGLHVSIFGFGTMTVGGKDRFANMGSLGVTETSRMLDICTDAGATLIDTADLYSFGGAEEILGEVLKHRREHFVLATKVFMRMGPGIHDVGLSRKHVIAACEASLRRLRTDYIDLYMAHDPDMLTPVEETLRAFDELVSQGKVRYIGCSNHSAWQMMKALSVSERHGYARYISQEINYSLLGRDAEHELIPLGLDQGIGVMAWSPLGYGLLTGKWRRDSRPSETRLNSLEAPGTLDQERLYRIVDVLLEIANERNVSAAQVALNWVASKPCVSTVLIGARNEQQLRDNLAAASWSLTAEEVARLDAASATPEPYPNWHHRRFGAERNPQLPSIRTPLATDINPRPKDAAPEDDGILVTKK